MTATVPVTRGTFTSPPSIEVPHAYGASRARQPYAYARTVPAEPDWRRFPGWSDVTEDEWRSVQWQRSHCVKNPAQLRAVLGDLVDDRLYEDLERDQAERATMSILVTPQLLNTMAAATEPAGPGSLTEAFYADPVRRYMLPVLSERRTDWPSHPHATRDSLHEHEMWVAEGLTHRYPTKVLAELLPTCPQYCGHCTRMDIVGNSTPQVDKLKFALKPADRFDEMLDYLRRSPGVRDVVVSGGDVANLPWPRLEAFVDSLLDIENIRDIRLATKALMALPQHWLGRRRPRGHGPPRARSPGSAGCPSRCTRTSTRRSRSRRCSPRRSARCSTPGCATCATRACCCAGSTTPCRSCSTSASRCSTAPASCPTTSTCAT